MTLQTEEDAKMPFMEHLRELRSRIVKSLLAIIAGFCVCYAYSDVILGWISLPLQRAINSLVTQGRLPESSAVLHFQDPLEPFFAYLTLSFVAGIFVSAPVILYQIWAFIGPGLYSKEKRVVLPMVFLGTLFFIGGGAFCYYIVLQYAMEFLIGYGLTDNVGGQAIIAPLLMLDPYLSRAEQLLLAFAIVFELPLIVGALAWLNIVTPQSLWRWNRHILIAILIVAAVLTPTGDPVNLLIMAVPMAVLFELSVVFTFLLHRSRAKKKALEATLDTKD
jgi:sec-independent protein translocase protein TatC